MICRPLQCKKNRIQKNVLGTNRWAKYDTITGKFVGAKRNIPYKNVPILIGMDKETPVGCTRWRLGEDGILYHANCIDMQIHPDIDLDQEPDLVTRD